jgi:hypothetical protein
MTTVFQLDKEDLRAEIKEVLREFLSEIEIKNSEPYLPETGGIELAVEVLNRSKSWIYKMTSQNLIPCRKFGSKIIFNRFELTQWMNERTIDAKQPQLEKLNKNLKESAKKKLKCAFY